MVDIRALLLVALVAAAAVNASNSDDDDDHHHHHHEDDDDFRHQSPCLASTVFNRYWLLENTAGSAAAIDSMFAPGITSSVNGAPAGSWTGAQGMAALAAGFTTAVVPNSLTSAPIGVGLVRVFGIVTVSQAGLPTATTAAHFVVDTISCLITEKHFVENDADPANIGQTAAALGNVVCDPIKVYNNYWTLSNTENSAAALDVLTAGITSSTNGIPDKFWTGKQEMCSFAAGWRTDTRDVTKSSDNGKTTVSGSQFLFNQNPANPAQTATGSSTFIIDETTCKIVEAKFYADMVAEANQGQSAAVAACPV